MANFKNKFKKFLGFAEDINEIDKIEFNKYDDKDEKQNTPDDIVIRPVKQEITIYPKSFADASTIVEQLEIGHIVIVNMNNLDIETSKRISDFILGAIFVLEGDVEKMSKRVFRFWTNN